MENQESKGYVYILTNPSFKKDWIKIGKTSRPVIERVRDLNSSTAIPLPFSIYATIQTSKYNELEKFVHNNLDHLTKSRINSNREFFKVEPQDALNVFYDLAPMFDDAVVIEYKDNKPIEPCLEVTKKKLPIAQKRSRFKFSMVGIPIGEMITFVPTGIQVRVASDDTVEYEGRIYKLSPFVGTFMPADKRNASGAYQGAKYFSYNGKILDDMRCELENL